MVHNSSQLIAFFKRFHLISKLFQTKFQTNVIAIRAISRVFRQPTLHIYFNFDTPRAGNLQCTMWQGGPMGLVFPGELQLPGMGIPTGPAHARPRLRRGRMPLRAMQKRIVEIGMLNWSLTVWKVWPRVMHSAARRNSSSERLMRRFEPPEQMRDFFLVSRV